LPVGIGNFIEGAFYPERFGSVKTINIWVVSGVYRGPVVELYYEEILISIWKEDYKN